jgi:Family of unknown function (DUF5397)
MQPGFPAPQLIGQFRTFGLFGPAYRVLAPVKQAESGDWMLRIQIVETGEETEYPYSQAVNDPEAH